MQTITRKQIKKKYYPNLLKTYALNTVGHDVRRILRTIAGTPRQKEFDADVIDGLLATRESYMQAAAIAKGHELPNSYVAITTQSKAKADIEVKQGEQIKAYLRERHFRPGSLLTLIGAAGDLKSNLVWFRSMGYSSKNVKVTDFGSCEAQALKAKATSLGYPEMVSHGDFWDLARILAENRAPFQFLDFDSTNMFGFAERWINANIQKTMPKILRVVGSVRGKRPLSEPKHKHIKWEILSWFKHSRLPSLGYRIPNPPVPMNYRSMREGKTGCQMYSWQAFLYN
jgi:hypothetical protein